VKTAEGNGRKVNMDLYSASSWTHL